MYWLGIPEWLTEARAAIFVSVLSAIFTGLTLRHTRRLALNDTARMKRKPLVFEKSISDATNELSGWSYIQIAVRNLEPVGARITGVKVKHKHQRILTRADAYSEAQNPFGERTTLKADLPELRQTDIVRHVGPCGATQSQSGSSPGDTIYLSVYVKGVDRLEDVEIVWQWADGTPI